MSNYLPRQSFCKLQLSLLLHAAPQASRGGHDQEMRRGYWFKIDFYSAKAEVCLFSSRRCCIFFCESWQEGDRSTFVCMKAAIEGTVFFLFILQLRNKLSYFPFWCLTSLLRSSTINIWKKVLINDLSKFNDKW